MPVYSHSRLSTYEQCPLRYKFAYVDKVKREVEGIEAFLGNRVHEALQKCYDDLKFAKVNSLEDLLACYVKLWQDNWHGGITINDKERTAEDYRNAGRKHIEGYYQRYAPFDSDITIATEYNVNFSLDDVNKYRMTGYIDRLARTPDGIYVIHDYKTSLNYLPPQQELDKDRQLGLYHIGVQRTWPDVKDIRLVWHYLAFDAELVSSRTPEALSVLIDNTTSLIDRLEAEDEFLPKETYCDWCEYPDLCPKRKHLVMVEALPENEYLTEPGVVLVNKLAELKHAEKEIDAEMDKVKEAIVEYARREEVEAIRGDAHVAKVSFEQRLKFPGKNDAQRPGLDAVIKQAGKWDDVSQLDTGALGRVIAEEEWDKRLIDKVIEYGSIEESTSVRLSKLKGEENVWHKLSFEIATGLRPSQWA